MTTRTLEFRRVWPPLGLGERELWRQVTFADAAAQGGRPQRRDPARRKRHTAPRFDESLNGASRGNQGSGGGCQQRGTTRDSLSIAGKDGLRSRRSHCFIPGGPAAAPMTRNARWGALPGAEGSGSQRRRESSSGFNTSSTTGPPHHFFLARAERSTISASAGGRGRGGEGLRRVGLIRRSTPRRAGRAVWGAEVATHSCR